MTQAVWQPFVLSLGAPMSTLGLLESLGGWRGVVTALIQPFGGWLSDRVGRKPLIAAGSLIGLIAIAFYLLAAFSGSWLWLLPGTIFLGLTMASIPAHDSLVAESAHVSQRGMAYSIFTLAWTVPGIFAPALGGFIADHWGFSPVFLLRLSLEGLCLLIIFRLLQETVTKKSGGVSLQELKELTARLLVPPRRLRGLYWAMAIDGFSWGFGLALLFGMLSESFGFTTFQLGLLSGISSLAWAIFQLPVGRLVDRYGCKLFMVLSEIVALVVVGGWLFSTQFISFAILHAAFGLTAAIWVPAELALLANSAPQEKRGETMGGLAAFRGLASFPAPFLGGLLYDRFGFQAPVLANLIGVVVALVVILVAVHEPPRQSAVD